MTPPEKNQVWWDIRYADPFLWRVLPRWHWRRLIGQTHYRRMGYRSLGQSQYATDDEMARIILEEAFGPAITRRQL